MQSGLYGKIYFVIPGPNLTIISVSKTSGDALSVALELVGQLATGSLIIEPTQRSQNFTADNRTILVDNLNVQHDTYTMSIVASVSEEEVCGDAPSPLSVYEEVLYYSGGKLVV